MCGQSWKKNERERKNHWASCVFLYRVDYIRTCCIFVMIWWLFTKKKVALNKPHQYKWPHVPAEGERESEKKLNYTNPKSERREIRTISGVRKKAKKWYTRNTNLNTEWIINTDNENGFVCGIFFYSKECLNFCHFFPSLVVCKLCLIQSDYSWNATKWTVHCLKVLIFL